MTGQNARWVSYLGLALVLAACEKAPATPPPPAAEAAAEAPAPKATPAPVVNLTPEEFVTKRVADLVAINTALQAYHAKNGSYPLSKDTGFTGVIDGGTNWIPELVPAFIPSLPRDPLMSEDPAIQYRYASDGKTYKLIVHGVPCEKSVERDGVKMDPARTKDGSCWAYGFWSDGRANF